MFTTVLTTITTIWRPGLIDEDPQGQVKFVRLFKVTVLNLHDYDETRD